MLQNRIAERLASTQEPFLTLEGPPNLDCGEVIEYYGEFSISLVPTDDREVLKAKLAAQESLLEELRMSILYLKDKVLSEGPSRSYFEVRDARRQVEAITAETFRDAPYEVLEVDDHEIENDRHFTFRVIDRADIKDVLQRYDTWHARLSDVPEAARGMFRLSVDLSQ